MSFLKAEKFKDLTNKNINNIKVYKNKSESENYCTAWINIWRNKDLETNKLSSKWLDSVLNDQKKVDMP